MSIIYTGPSIDASYHVSVYLTRRFQRIQFFRNRPIRNKNCQWPPCLITNRAEMSNLYRGPSIDAPYQVWFHLAMRFQRRRIWRNQPIRNKNCLWLPCLLMDQDEMSNLYRRPSIDASYQGSVHLAMQFQRRRILRNQPIRNKNCQWPPCLSTDRAEMSNLYKGPWIDASYQIPIHLAKWFQRRRFKKIDQSESRIASGSHVCWWIGTKWAIFIEDLP